MKYFYRCLLVSALGILLGACSSAPVKVNLYAAQHLNPDSNQQALPVVLRLYQLADSKRFLQATFWELWKSDQTTLGSSVLTRTVVVATPGVSQGVAIKRDKSAQYLGIVAIFRNPTGNSWRTIERLPKAHSLISVNINVRLDGNKVLIENQEKNVRKAL